MAEGGRSRSYISYFAGRYSDHSAGESAADRLATRLSQSFFEEAGSAAHHGVYRGRAGTFNRRASRFRHAATFSSAGDLWELGFSSTGVLTRAGGIAGAGSAVSAQASSSGAHGISSTRRPKLSLRVTPIAGSRFMPNRESLIHTWIGTRKSASVQECVAMIRRGKLGEIPVCTKPLRGGRCGVGLRLEWWLG